MNKKRLSADSRSSSFQWFWRWFGELPPQIKVILIGVVAVGIIFMLLPKSLFHSFNCDTQNLPQNHRSSNSYFIDNQVIVLGRGEDVDDVIGVPTPVVPTTPGAPPTGETLSVVGTPSAPGTPGTPVVTVTPAGSDKVILNLIEDCDLSYLDSRSILDSNATREPRDLVMRLYEIPTGSTVEKVISEIDDKAQGREIFTDPNYLTRLADLSSDPCARPADPGGAGGGPFGDPGTLNSTAYDPVQAEDAFKNQWAFGPDGINFLSSSVPLTGHDIQIGVFDTSPYRISFPFIKWVAEAFPSPLWFTVWDAGGNTIVSNHGLFVAGLIHRIAPKSHIQLIRVLNDDGCGDLWTLNKGLESYVSRMSAWEGNLDETVINMSLGISTPSEADSENLDTLKSLITKAYEQGAIIVAAAGNDSPNRPAQEMQIPAYYKNIVIGVAATDKEGNRSCYSNKGLVAAPGGNGGRANERQPDDTTRMNPCAARASNWNTDLDPCPDDDMANCEYGLISLSQTRYGSQYILWSGTSFAAPLVSGLAALAYEEWERDQVRCLIEAGGSVRQAGLSTPNDEMGWGLINVAESLSNDALTACGVRP